MLGDKGYKSNLKKLDQDVEAFDNYMSMMGGKGGRIVIEYYSEGELSGLLEKLLK